MKVLGVLFLVLLLIVGAGAYVLLTPYGPSAETFVDVPAGTGVRGIATALERAGVVRNRYVFEAWHSFRHSTLKAGEYRFDHPVKVEEVYDRMVRGDVYTISVTIPEGYNLFDIAATVQHAGLASGDSFLAAARTDTSLISDLSPGAASLEGYLFPDTYKFSRHATPEQMLAAMVKRFRKEATSLGVTSDVARTVTMASLVEKEVRVAGERPLVAGVFENRLAKGMPLATDPTVIYAALLEGRWRGTIYKSDLQSDSPYNTYKHAGLPPGPICSPGVAALRATLHPAETNYLYFVADAAGHSVFSADLKEHDTHVQEYRRAMGASSEPPAPSKGKGATPKPATHGRKRHK